MKYTVYKTTNNINGKIYIGKHKTENPNDEYLGSGLYLKRAIEKYGGDKFTKEILYEFDSEEEMNLMEASIVDEEFIARLDTYNIKLGGSGGWDHIESSWDHVNSNLTQEFIDNRSEKVSIGLKYYFNGLDKSSKEWKEIKEQWKKNFGEKRWGSGSHHTESAKRKIGEANSKYQSGSGNSQFGTCWVCKNGIAIKIKRENLNEYLDNGYSKGRK